MLHESANFIQIQRELIWEELEYLLKDIKYPLDLVITPPMNWFKNPKKEKIIRTYNKLLNKFSKLDQVKKMLDDCRSGFLFLPDNP